MECDDTSDAGVLSFLGHYGVLALPETCLFHIWLKHQIVCEVLWLNEEIVSR